MSRGGYREGAGGKSTWVHGKTKTIRVPEALADKIIAYARDLDEGRIPELRQIETIEASQVIDLGGVSLKAIDGQMGVKLSDLVKKGYSLTPDRLQQITVNALKNRKKV